jgi:hypothetical protein
MPVQLPVVQTNGQAVPVFCQFPATSQVCGWRPLHFIDDGAHAPVQLPPAHTFVQTAPMSFQTPVASQSWG